MYNVWLIHLLQIVNDVISLSLSSCIAEQSHAITNFHYGLKLLELFIYLILLIFFGAVTRIANPKVFNNLPACNIVHRHLPKMLRRTTRPCSLIEMVGPYAGDEMRMKIYCLWSLI